MSQYYTFSSSIVGTPLSNTQVPIVSNINVGSRGLNQRRITDSRARSPGIENYLGSYIGNDLKQAPLWGAVLNLTDIKSTDQHIWQDDGTDALRFATASVPASKH